MALALGVLTAFPLLQTTPAVAAGTTPKNVLTLQDRLRKEMHDPDFAKLPPPKSPTVPLHTEFIVQTNSKGQTASVKSAKLSNDQFFNTATFGNAVQTFIHRDDGHTDAGTFRLLYDYSPKTGAVSRTMHALSLGGVDPNAVGLVEVLARRSAAKSVPTPVPHRR